MAVIAYSCCGEGRGHSSRTLLMARRLREAGHEVHLFGSHEAYRVLSAAGESIQEIPGYTIAYENNQVRLRKTVRENFARWRQQNQIVMELTATLRRLKPTLVITDFEPFLPKAAANLDIPYISLDHQHVIPGLKLKTPARYWGYHAATLGVVHWMHRGERENLVTSFYRPERAFGERYRYFGPILRDAVRQASTRDDGHVLVYQTSSSFKSLPNLLRRCPGKFKVYAFQEGKEQGNCRFKPRNHPDFLEDLATCSWVLTNGGYTLISEALYLGKAIVSIPIEGQFEQWINAHFVQKLGYGVHLETSGLNRESIESFWSTLPAHRERIAKGSFDGNEAILEAVLKHM